MVVATLPQLTFLFTLKELEKVLLENVKSCLL